MFLAWWKLIKTGACCKKKSDSPQEHRNGGSNNMLAGRIIEIAPQGKFDNMEALQSLQWTRQYIGS